MIDTVLFDMGGTLEDIEYDHDIRLEGTESVLKCLKDNGINIDMAAEEFLEILERRNAEYKAWCENSLIESPTVEIWHKWHLKDFEIPEDKLSNISEDLSVIWETKFYRRSLRKDSKATLNGLKERGYKLGIISNTSSCSQVISTLKEYGIDKYFDCVCLSSIENIRKPSVDIFMKAVNELGSSVERCVYVGDTIARDVIGSKNAGFAAAIQISSFLTKTVDSKVENETYKPDYVISNMSEILNILDKADC